MRSAVALAAVALSGTLVAGCHRPRLLPRADGAAVVVVSPDSGGNVEPGVTYAAEVEPNGTVATAQKLDLGASPVLGVSAHLDGVGKAKDVDVYQVVVPPLAAAAPAAPGDASPAAPPARRRLSAEVRPEAPLAVTVEALDDAGQPLAAATGGQPGEPEGIPSLAVTPGTYYLRIKSPSSSSSSSPSSSSYRLVVRLLPLDTGEEIEPNGKSALATDLPLPGEVVGYFGWRKDQDWYRVPLAGVAEGSVLSADLEPVPGVAASLVVLDSVERKLTEAHGRKDERVAVRNVRLPAGEPHLFLVARADSGRSLDVRYNLRARTELPKAGGELEPNDDAAHANPIADGTVTGYIARGDVDVYRYTAAAAEPMELDVEAAPPERVDLKLEVIREPDGLLLLRADSGKRHEPERLANLYAPAGGALLIRIAAAKGDANLDEPYRLTVTSHPSEPGAEHEPNGTAASATPLAAGAAGTGLIFPRGDVDYWQVSAPADADGNVALTTTGIAGTTLELRVLSSSEKELARFKVTGDSPVTNRFTPGAEPCCLLQIRDPSGKTANFRDRYTITAGK
jgi:hypothetical protein